MDRREGRPQADAPGHGTIAMLSQIGETWGETAGITFVVVEDVDAVCERATTARDVFRGQPVDKPLGLRQAVVTDPEGQRWGSRSTRETYRPCDL